MSKHWQIDGGAAATTTVTSVEAEPSTNTPDINLKEALQWLLGGEEQNELSFLSEEARQERQRRREDLLVWLMNLEVRLQYNELA